MGTIRLLWRDADRLPYLYTVQQKAAAYGTELVMNPAPGREFGEHLFDGTADVVAENYWNQQINRAKGWPLVSIAAAVNTVNERLFVRVGITSIDDLHGKRIAIRDQRPTNLGDPLWLRQVGLGDAELVMVAEAESGRWSPWKRVVDGDCDAAIVTNLFSQPAIDAGLTTLEIPAFAFLGSVVYTTSLEKLDAMRADMENLVRAAFDAVRTFKTDKVAVLAIMETIPAEPMQPPNITIATAEERERVYAHLRDELADPPIPTAQAIANYYEMARPHYPELEGYNPLTMWDLSIARAIIDGGGARRTGAH
jgi:hypothetical protein